MGGGCLSPPALGALGTGIRGVSRSPLPRPRLSRNHRPPGDPVRARPALGQPPPPRLFLFLPLADRPAPPRPGRPGAREAWLFASAWRREENQKEAPGAGGREGARRCIFIRAPAAAEAGAGPSGCGGLRGAGGPRERRAGPLCRPGGAGARGALRREAPPVCGASARQGPPGGRGERGANGRAGRFAKE